MPVPGILKIYVEGSEGSCWPDSDSDAEVDCINGGLMNGVFFVVSYGGKEVTMPGGTTVMSMDLEKHTGGANIDYITNGSYYFSRTISSGQVINISVVWGCMKLGISTLFPEASPMVGTMESIYTLLVSAFGGLMPTPEPPTVVAGKIRGLGSWTTDVGFAMWDGISDDTQVWSQKPLVESDANPVADDGMAVRASFLTEAVQVGHTISAYVNMNVAISHEVVDSQLLGTRYASITAGFTAPSGAQRDEARFTLQERANP